MFTITSFVPVVNTDKAIACPFCGCDRTHFNQHPASGVSVMCYLCGAEGPLEDDESEAIGAWNARA